MASTEITFLIRVRMRWWLKQWVRATLAIHCLTGWAPKEETRAAIIKRGVYAEQIK
ncbi:hypothetical protein [Herbaspirillum sp. SJZ107]|uniref:hypothetical protein n=1 Tax=Herbaspirillum sp. SJZ107 TaxID=2572881 RepID=UPI00116EA115|nr:hypothetical protein [Herbaspirillum sp. SJZ107]TQK10232.1 hypothetical protein FBX97_0148 [Herbaspirillum sp. SJZ107]